MQSLSNTWAKVLDATKGFVSDREKWSYEIIRSLLETADEHERPIILAGLISSHQEGNSTKNADGERLAALLGALGGPFIKFGQAANSHPDTPEDAAKPLGKLKSDAQEISRENLLELINTRLPARERSSIVHVGKVLGNASFYVSVEVERRNDAGEIHNEVLSLVKENAEERGENGFKRIEAIINNFVTRNPSYASSGKVLKEHFNDLPEKTPDQIAEKKRGAKAMLAVELLNILRGEEFDHDRHGAQSRFQNRHVGLFDHGGMMIRKPTPAEIRAGAEAVGEIFGGIKTFASSDSVQDIITKVDQRHPEAHEYLQNLKKGLLALNDFAGRLSFGERLDVLDAVMHTGEVHPAYLEALNGHFALTQAPNIRRRLQHEQIIIR